MPRVWDEFLTACARTGECVEVYRDRLAGGEALVGRIVRFSSTILLIERIDDSYEFDGFSAVLCRDVTRVVSGHRELRFASRVMERQTVEFPGIAVLAIESAISIFEKLFGHVAVYVEAVAPDTAFIGNVAELDDDHLSLKTFGTHRNLDRANLLVRLEDITRADAGGQYERRLVEHFSSSALDLEPSEAVGPRREPRS